MRKKRVANASTQEKGRPLPKFGEWDVNNPASADGFTVIFAKARDDKKANASATPTQAPRQDYAYGQPNPYQQEPRGNRRPTFTNTR
ncbi:hypothetical protein RND71_011197 [Anisodus tanguticus]|uniref:RIN4 pathogenic type III effector avirulence factor Avr cleavage site domain-containing protein n=1 Tax=Anisodus tanguticus TaxID=243964 RepID=A0AAE1VPH6_9SOLA|nr:hypothetical protein RND71_032570 [Anisodus tanguticus]KAK4367405.1 hypothetical protein RND71_011197 [Anisodus tanguticus]